MFDHLEFRIECFDKSLKFYSSCLPLLGARLIFSNEKNRSFGFGRDEWTEFLLSEGVPTAPKLHIAFRATSKEQVNEFYRKAIESGGVCSGPPGYREDYHSGYYAAFVLDPDGHNIEVLYRAWLFK